MGGKLRRRLREVKRRRCIHGVVDLTRQAMALAADLVGGIPWIEPTDADRSTEVAFCRDLARELGKDGNRRDTSGACRRG
jgi:hypothetical protein